MTVSNELIERLSSETGRRLSDRARQGRREALAHISRFCVTWTRDGKRTHEEYFDRSPTLGQIVERAGPDAYIVSITMKRQPLRERLRLALVAE